MSVEKKDQQIGKQRANYLTPAINFAFDAYSFPQQKPQQQQQRSSEIKSTTDKRPMPNLDLNKFSHSQLSSFLIQDVPIDKPKKLDSHSTQPKSLPVKYVPPVTSSSSSSKPTPTPQRKALTQKVINLRVHPKVKLNSFSRPDNNKQNGGSTIGGGYLSSRTFSNLETVQEVEREEFSRCSDESSKTTSIKTWSMMTNESNTLSSMEPHPAVESESSRDVQEVQTQEEEREEEVAKEDEVKQSSDEAVKQSEEEEVAMEARRLCEPSNAEEIAECRNFLVKIGVISEAKESANYACKSDVIEEVFKSINVSGTGKIIVEDVMVVLNKINENFDKKYAYTQEELRQFVDQLDSDRDGSINLQEFILSFDKF